MIRLGISLICLLGLVLAIYLALGWAVSRIQLVP